MTIKIRERKDRGWLEVDIALRLPDGTIHRERKKSPVATKSATQKWAEARERQILADALLPKPARRPDVQTLKEFWPRFLRDHVKASGHKASGQHSKNDSWKNYIGPAFGDLRMDEITDEKVARLRGEMIDRGLAKATINKHFALLSKMLKMAIEWKLLAAMPCRIKKLKAQLPAPKFYKEHELERLLEVAGGLDPRIHLLVLLAADAGLRRGEIIALEWAHCDLERGLLTVENAEWEGVLDDVKGIATGTVPMTTRLREALAAQQHELGPRVLYQDDGRSLQGSTIRKWMTHAQKGAGLKATGEIHILRHTFCSRLAMRGVPALTIQALAHHKHLVTTLRYMHLAPGETDRAIAMLEGRVPAGTSLEPSSKPATFQA